jgi:hypothetical protein
MDILTELTQDAYLVRTQAAFVDAHRQLKSTDESFAEVDWSTYLAQGDPKEQSDLENLLKLDAWHTRQLRALVVLLVPSMDLVPYFCGSPQWKTDTRYTACCIPSIPFGSLISPVQTFAGVLLACGMAHVRTLPDTDLCTGYRQLMGDLLMVIPEDNPLFEVLVHTNSAMSQGAMSY